MGGNITTDKNRVNYIDGLAGANIIGGSFGSNGAIYLTKSVVGMPVSEFYGYVYQGLYKPYKADIDRPCHRSARLG